MTVARLRREMSTVEFAQWLAYWKYKAALQDRARRKADLKADGKRKAKLRGNRSR